MDIEEVKRILGYLRILGLFAPKHIFIVDEPVFEKFNGMIFYRGLAVPGESVIVLSRHADETTIPHEIVHSSFGLGEIAARIIGRIAGVKIRFYNMIGFKPMVEHRYVEGEVPREYVGRVKHYIRVN